MTEREKERGKRGEQGMNSER